MLLLILGDTECVYQVLFSALLNNWSRAHCETGDLLPIQALFMVPIK